MAKLVPVPDGHNPFVWQPPQPDPISGQIPADPVGNVLQGLPGYVAGKAADLYDTAVGTPLDIIEGRQSLNDPATQDKVIGLGGMLAAPGLGADDASVLSTGATKSDPIIAYHGSPHSFDKFDMSKLGTGEGAQVYGHGMYFAGNEDVARSYRDNLSDPGVISVDGIPIPEDHPLYEAANHIASGISPEDAMSQSSARISSLQDKLKNATDSRLISFLKDGIGQEQQFQSSLQALAGKSTEMKSPGHMYQVSINADPNHFLDWDAPLAEQHPVVQDKTKAILGIKDVPDNVMQRDDGRWVMTSNGQPVSSGPFSGNRGFSDKDGAQYAMQLQQQRNAELMNKSVGEIMQYKGVPETSKAIRDAGIPGIKYLDQGSRSLPVEGATHNYVVFNDKNIDILKKYGLAGIPLAGGAIGAGMSTQPTADGHDPFATVPTGVPQT